MGAAAAAARRRAAASRAGSRGARRRGRAKPLTRDTQLTSHGRRSGDRFAGLTAFGHGIDEAEYDFEPDPKFRRRLVAAGLVRPRTDAEMDEAEWADEGGAAGGEGGASRLDEMGLAVARGDEAARVRAALDASRAAASHAAEAIRAGALDLMGPAAGAALGGGGGAAAGLGWAAAPAPPHAHSEPRHGGPSLLARRRDSVSSRPELSRGRDPAASSFPHHHAPSSSSSSVRLPSLPPTPLSSSSSAFPAALQGREEHRFHAPSPPRGGDAPAGPLPPRAYAAPSSLPSLHPAGPSRPLAAGVADRTLTHRHIAPADFATTTPQALGVTMPAEMRKRMAELEAEMAGDAGLSDWASRLQGGGKGSGPASAHASPGSSPHRDVHGGAPGSRERATGAPRGGGDDGDEGEEEGSELGAADPPVSRAVSKQLAAMRALRERLSRVAGVALP